MPKVPDPDKILKAVMQNLKRSGVLDDVAKAGGNLADDISKIMSEMTGKAAKPAKPAKPKLPKKPPKSKPASQDIPPLKPGASKAEAKARMETLMQEEWARVDNIKAKRSKSGSADKMEREARRQANRDNWAKEREAYNKMKAIEREERKAANRAKWAKTLEEKYDGNWVEARKATSKGRNRNKKDKK